MKRIISILLCIPVILCMVSCEENNTEKEQSQQVEETAYEVAVIADGRDAKEGSFTQVTWNSVKAFADENGLAAKCYKPEKSVKKAYMAAVKEAVENKAKIIVMSGSRFETSVFTAQKKYPEVYFLLIDGVPNDNKNNYAMTSNTISIIFAEEEVGYLAGYAAVKDGYTKLGFLGSKELPTIKRYGYGFVQGAASAASEMKTKVKIRYDYAGTFKASNDVEKLAAKWYKRGTQVIFACGGPMQNSVIKAAEKKNGKVIGADVDQRYLSASVITSAKKEIPNAVNDILEIYTKGKFIGETAFSYGAKNDGVSLEMENAQFSEFGIKDYEKIMKTLKAEKLDLKKDTDVDSLSELAGEWVKIN